MDKDFIKATTEYLFINEKPVKADVIFIPGGSYEDLPRHAARLYLQGYAPILVPSGKYSITKGRFAGEGDYATECAFYTAVMERLGVPSEAIIGDAEASYTYENALFSKKLLDEKGIYPKKALLICKPYHARRAYTYYKGVFCDTEIVVCPAPYDNVNADNWHLTEKGKRAVLGELSRLGAQMGGQLE